MEPVGDYRGRRVTVIGLGRFGGGVGAVRFLAERGARVTVTDSASEDQLAESLEELRGVPLEALRLGGHAEADFAEADLIVVNPAVRRDNPYLSLARGRGIPLTSEMNLFWRHNRGRTVGVTGSNGKSTTTALIHSILQVAGLRSRLGGNIGRSLLPEVEDIHAEDWSVLELSSFQLDDLDRIRASPDVAVVTNFSPNHLDWHGTLDEYRRSKQTILRWQRADGVAVLNESDPDVRRWPAAGRRLGFGLTDAGAAGCFAEHVGDVRRAAATYRNTSADVRLEIGQWLPLAGRHNLENALAAACATLAVGVGLDAVREGISTFTALPHRLQFVAEVAGRSFYNDSLATTPESAAAALESFSRPIVLLAGGYDKHVPLDGLAESAARRCRAVALMGQTGPRLAEQIPVGGGNAPELVVAGSFEEAFAWAVSRSRPGDVVLLSPGCASYDWFRNFAERGERLVELVRRWREAAAPAAAPGPRA